MPSLFCGNKGNHKARDKFEKPLCRAKNSHACWDSQIALAIKWKFGIVSSEVIHNGKTRMLIKKARAKNICSNYFELLMDFVLVLVSQHRLSTWLLNLLGYMTKFERNTDYLCYS